MESYDHIPYSDIEFHVNYNEGVQRFTPSLQQQE